MNTEWNEINTQEDIDHLMGLYHHFHDSCLKELKYYADIFKSFVYDEDTYSSKIMKALKNIRLLKQTTCYPFLLHVFDDYEQDVIDEITLEKVVEFINDYNDLATKDGKEENVINYNFSVSVAFDFVDTFSDPLDLDNLGLPRMDMPLSSPYLMTGHWDKTFTGNGVIPE